MPTIKWNKSWAGNLKSFTRGELPGDKYGDQWGAVKASPMLSEIVDRFITPFVDKDHVALEIGSGGGRWTEHLLGFSKIYCVDLNKEMFAYLRERFQDNPTLQFVHTKGTNLPGIELRSVDYVFTFGTLVHLDVPIIEDYIRSVADVCKKGAVICLQFSDKRKEMAASNPDFSDNDPERMSEIVQRFGFSVDEVDEEILPHSAIIRGTKL